MRVPIVLAIVAFTIGGRLYTGPSIVDDAYITFRTSRNLAQGRGFTYNPPERVQATTAPAFAGALALGERAGVAPERLAPLVSLLADLVSLSLILLLFARAHAASVGWGAASLLAISPLFLTYSVSGLETSLFIAFQLSAAVASGQGRDRVAVAIAAVGTLLRPDGLLMLVLVWGRSLRHGARNGAINTLVAAAVLLPWLAFSAWYFEQLLPQSVVAKHATSADVTASLATLRAIFLTGKYLPLTLLAITGFVVCWRKYPDPAIRVWLGWTAAYLVAFTAAGAFTHFMWYLVPLLPAYFACVAVAAAEVTKRRRTAAMAVATVALLTAGGFRLPSHKNFLNALRHQREQLYLESGARIAREGTRCVVAATEIGAVGYTYPGPILDLVGIASPEVIGHPMQQSLERGGAAWLVSYDTHLEPGLRDSEWFRRAFDARWSARVSPQRTLLVFRRRGMDCR